MHQRFATLVFFLFLVSPAFGENGLVSVKSAHDVAGTSDRLERILTDKGMTVFIRINHAQGAQKAGKVLRPTELILFGNPKVGTPLMQCARTMAIDLPQKALIWQDEKGTVWLTYNRPQYLADRHRLEGCASNALQKVTTTLDTSARAATRP